MHAAQPSLCGADIIGPYLQRGCGDAKMTITTLTAHKSITVI
jgi:hypothetical protein